jgi:hypothetical protein
MLAVVLSESEVRQAVEAVRGIVAAVEAGEMTATPGVLDQLRGSLVALEALLGDQGADG